MSGSKARRELTRLGEAGASLWCSQVALNSAAQAGDVALCQAVTLPEGALPEFIHLLPAGTAQTVDGRGPYRAENPAEIARQSLEACRLPIDENHAIDLAAPEGRASPARGWIVALEARQDGIWARSNGPSPGSSSWPTSPIASFRR